MADYENFQIEREGSVAHVTIDSTSPMNTLNPEMGEELLDWTTTIPYEEEIRCVTLTGSGGAFGAGADLTRLDGGASDTAGFRRLASYLHDGISHLYRSPVPVVTGVNGVAAGAGFSMAILGDIVLVSDEARFEYAYPRIGLTGDGASTFLLPRLVGLRRAKEIVLKDEPIDPDRAVEIGLASEVVPAAELEDRVAEVGQDLASGPTWALGQTLRLLTESYSRDFESQMAEEAETIVEASTTEDFSRGFAAFFEKEDPEFVGR